MLVVFSPIYVAKSKIIFRYDFVAPLKMMKNAFYFTVKALFVFEIIRFCSDFLIMNENGLIRKLR